MPCKGFNELGKGRLPVCESEGLAMRDQLALLLSKSGQKCSAAQYHHLSPNLVKSSFKPAQQIMQQ